MTMHHFFTYARHVYRAFLDHLFPASPDVVALEALTLDEWREHALKLQFHSRYPWCMSLMNFAEPAVRLGIHQMKFHKNIHVAQTFARLLDEGVAPFLAADASILSDRSVKLIIPIPISWTRKNDRGYNQVELLLEHCTFPARFGWTVETRLLGKRPGRSQTTRSTDVARAENVRNAFFVQRNPDALARIRDADIILIDDVVTTGSTLVAARNTLLAAGARSVQAVTLATG